MAQQSSDLQSILAALVAQNPGAAHLQMPASQAPPGMPFPGYPAAPPGLQPGGIPGFPLPQPTSSGSLDLSSIKPTGTGFLNLNDRSRAYGETRHHDQSRDSRRAGNAHRRSRSRSNSPPRRDSYNLHREDRREDLRRGGYGRDRSRSPPRGSRFSPPNGRGHGRDRSPHRDNMTSNDDSDVMSIESNLVGLVIGRQGENLRRIEQTTQARIQFITPPDHPGPQRQCRISGPPQARRAARDEIMRTIDENQAAHAQNHNQGQNQSRGAFNNRQEGKIPSQPVLREGEATVQIMVPDRTVGLIIGRGGETIRDLQERSGCHINIVGVNKSVDGLRPVNLIGSQQASAMAKNLIMEIVESDTRGSAGQHGQSGHHDHTSQNNTSFHAPQRNMNDSYQAPGKVNETIQVPSDAVGMIIGKGGETIREMQSTTQCKINVSQPVGADNERDIGLVGTPQALAAAKRAIQDKIDMVREKSAQRSTARNDGSDRYQQQQYGQQNAYGAQAYAQNPTQASKTGAAGAEDPYAPYGGYANYMALWYAAIQNGAKPPGQEGGA